jgi:hypothetical protein
MPATCPDARAHADPDVFPSEAVHGVAQKVDSALHPVPRDAAENSGPASVAVADASAAPVVDRQQGAGRLVRVDAKLRVCCWVEDRDYP